MIEIEVPDGTILEFPDTMSEDEILGVLRKQYPTPVNDNAPSDYVDNEGPLSYFADIIDREKSIGNAIDLYNQMLDIDPEEDLDGYLAKQLEYKSAIEAANQYARNEKDNFLESLGKELAADVFSILGAGVAGATVGGPLGAAAGAGSIGFERSRRQQRVFNAYRELTESGDLTPEEARAAGKFAIGQALLEGSIDAATAGLAGAIPKIGTALVKKLAVDAAGGAASEVGSNVLQRAYVSNLDILGEDAVAEYLESAAIGAFAQTALGASFEGVNRLIDRPNAVTSETPEQILEKSETNPITPESQADLDERLRQFLYENEPEGAETQDLFEGYVEKTEKQKVDKIESVEDNRGINEIIQLGERDKTGELIGNGRLINYPKRNILQIQSVDAKKPLNFYRKAAIIASQRGTRLASKTSLSADEYQTFKSLKKDGVSLKENPTTVKGEDGRYRTSNKLPVFVATSYPKDLSVPQRTKKTTKLVPEEDQYDLFQNVDKRAKRTKEGAEIQSTLEKVFSQPHQLVTLRRLSNDNILNLGKTDLYKSILDNQNKIINKQVAEQALADVDTTIKATESPTDNPKTIPGVVAKGLKQVYSEPANIARDLNEVLSNIEKESSRDPRSMPVKWYSMFLDPQTLGRMDEATALLTNFFQSKGNFGQRLQGLMMVQKRVLQQDMKSRGVWEKSNELLDNLNKYDGSIDEGYIDPNTNQKITLTPEQKNDVRALDAYFKTPLETLKRFEQEKLKSFIEAGNTEAADIATNKIKQLNNALSKPYFPRYRLGDIWMKIGDAVYDIERVTGADKSIPGFRHRLHYIGDGIYVTKEDYARLRQRVKDEQGIVLPKIPKQLQRKSTGKDLDDQVFFQRDIDAKINNRSISDMVSDEKIMSLLTETDGKKLDALKSRLDVDTFNALIRPSRKIEGYSKDYDRNADMAASSMSDRITNYMFEPNMRVLAERYATNENTIAKKYWDRVMRIGDERTEEVFDNFARIQAILALGYRASTAVLQTASLVSSVPIALSVMSANPTTHATYLGKGLQLANNIVFNSNLNVDAVLSDVDKLTELTGDRKFAEFLVANPILIGNNPRADFKRSKQNKTMALSQGISNFEDGAHWMMMTAEKATRISAAYASFKMAQNPKYQKRAIDQLMNDNRFKQMYSENNNIPVEHLITNILLDNSFGIYGRMGWAGMQNGIGRLAAPFATYPLQITNTLFAAIKGMRGPRAQLGAFGVVAGMGLLFGMQGVPFYEVAELIYEQYHKIFHGQSKEMSNDLFDALYEIDPDLARFMKRGFVGSLIGVDFSRRVSLGNPYSAFTSFLTEDGPMGRDIGFLLPKAGQIKDALATQDPKQIAYSMAPIVLDDLFKGFVDWEEKGVTTRQGTTIVPSDSVGLDDRIKKALGFNPMSVSNAQNAYYFQYKEKTKYTLKKQKAVRSAYKHFKNWVESGKSDEQSREKIIEVINDLRDAYIENGDPFTKTDYDNIINSLKTMYENEKHGFAGGKNKANFGKETEREAREFLKRLEG